MLYRGSYHNGFAPRDFEPAYPELWRGCVGAWCPSLGPTGGVLRDWSGRQNHGTLTNTTLDTVWSNHQGCSLAFDGTNDYVNCGTGVSALISSMSVSFWIKTSSAGGSHTVIAQATAGAAANFAITHGYGGGAHAGKLQWWNDGSGTNAETTGTVNNGQWHHVLAVRTGSSGAWTITWYIDGVLDSSPSLATNPVNAASPTTCIGTFGAFLTFYLNAALDDVRIYSTALSLSQVGELYFNGRGRGIAYSYNQPRGSLTLGESSESSGTTFPGLAWRNLKKWRFVVRAGVDGNWPRVT